MSRGVVFLKCLTAKRETQIGNRPSRSCRFYSCASEALRLARVSETLPVFSSPASGSDELVPGPFSPSAASGCCIPVYLHSFLIFVNFRLPRRLVPPFYAAIAFMRRRKLKATAEAPRAKRGGKKISKNPQKSSFAVNFLPSKC